MVFFLGNDLAKWPNHRIHGLKGVDARLKLTI
jgi:hypothetical protein